MASDISQFTQSVLNEFTERLTDQVFLFIENDRELLGQYLHTVEGKELDTVNAHIAQSNGISAWKAKVKNAILLTVN